MTKDETKPRRTGNEAQTVRVLARNMYSIVVDTNSHVKRRRNRTKLRSKCWPGIFDGVGHTMTTKAGADGHTRPAVHTRRRSYKGDEAYTGTMRTRAVQKNILKR